MAKKIRLTIPRPCHEDWDSMTPVEKGKFCGSCRKQVVDFSHMSDRQVAEFFRKPSTGSVCGRFMSGQLDRELEIPGKRIPWIRYFFTIALPAFFVSLKAAGSGTQGQPVDKKVIADTTGRRIYDDAKILGMVSRPQPIRPFMGDTIAVPVRKPVCDKPVMGKPASHPVADEITVSEPDGLRILSGIIQDHSGKPVPGASIILKGTLQGVVADEQGRFLLKMKTRVDPIVLVGSAIGKLPVEVRVDSGREKEDIMIRFAADIPSFDIGVIVVVQKKKATRNKPVVVSEKDSPVPEKNIPDHFRVVPNPMAAGSDLTLECRPTEEGYYSLRLFSLSGQSVFHKEIWIDTAARLLHIHLPVLPPGSYFLIMTSKKSGKRFEEKLIIQ